MPLQLNVELAYNTKFHRISSTNAEEEACGYRRVSKTVRLPISCLFYELYGKHELTNLNGSIRSGFLNLLRTTASF